VIVNVRLDSFYAYACFYVKLEIPQSVEEGGLLKKWQVFQFKLPYKELVLRNGISLTIFNSAAKYNEVIETNSVFGLID
jgi:hypothetical protein